MTEDRTPATALDELVHAAADAPDDRWTLAALGAVVVDLEQAAGANLGAADHDPLVVLLRRLGRVHGRLLAGTATVTVARVDDLRASLTGAPPTRDGATRATGLPPVPATSAVPSGAVRLVAR